MNEQVIEVITRNILGIISQFDTNYIVLTGDDDDTVLPVTWLVSQTTRLPITPRRSEDELIVTPGYFAYPGLTLLPKVDDLDEVMRDDVRDLIMSVNKERFQQLTFEKFIKIKLLVIAIDTHNERITRSTISDFYNTKLG